jgi:hypothetical protein
VIDVTNSAHVDVGLFLSNFTFDICLLSTRFGQSQPFN